MDLEGEVAQARCNENEGCNKYPALYSRFVWPQKDAAADKSGDKDYAGVHAISAKGPFTACSAAVGAPAAYQVTRAEEFEAQRSEWQQG